MIETQSSKKVKRETFSSSLAIFFATLGSAVGLGNIWKFPYVTGNNGGGAFILVYVICVLLVGVPVLTSEYFLGRHSRSNAVGAFDKLKASKFWKSIGYLGVISGFLIMFYYSAVAGWVYSYVFKALKGDFSSLGTLSNEAATEKVGEVFGNTVGGNWGPFFWQIIAFLVVGLIIYLGVRKGIERVTKTLMPVLLVLLAVVAVRSLTLDGAAQGVNFLFNVDFSKITAPVILTAMGLAFFKLSIGMGVMLTYGSYFTEDVNIPGNAVKVVSADFAVSMLAGLAIFPVVFSFGLEPNSGPGLLFQTVPLVFSKIPFGNVLLFLFFLLTAIAATCAMTSIVEAVTAVFIEQFKLTRRMATIVVVSIMAVVGLLTVHPTSLFGTASLFGMNLFDLFGYVSDNITMPIGGLLIVIFTGYVMSKSTFFTELTNNETLKNHGFISFIRFAIKYVSPVLIILVFLNVIGVLPMILPFLK